jgi:hypothetical protein
LTDVFENKQLSAATAREIAKEAYIFGFPMLDEYRVMYAFSVDTKNPQYKGPFNSILNIARVFTPADTAFVTPNSDTPYSFANLDLRAEPVVISLPAIDKSRYFVFQMMDLYTFNFDYLGTRATGNDGGDFLIAGPDWTGAPPPGVKKVIRSETQLVMLVGRTQLFNPGDLENMKQVQAGYKLRTLSAYLGQPPKPAPEAAWKPPLSAEDQRSSPEFFGMLGNLLQFCPTHPTEVKLRARFAQIGIVPGQPLDTKALPADIQQALRDGMADGQKEIDARRAELGGKVDALFGTREFLHNDYVGRAVGAQAGIGANSREEALYPVYDADADGRPLDGGSARYKLKFSDLPPVNAFWSLTAYDLPSQLLISNPLNRYLVNSPMLPGLTRDADGGLTIYIQKDSPGPDKEANWLPAPNGPFMLAMRYYLPKPELLDGKWTSPPVERVA